MDQLSLRYKQLVQAYKGLDYMTKKFVALSKNDLATHLSENENSFLFFAFERRKQDNIFNRCCVC